MVDLEKQTNFKSRLAATISELKCSKNNFNQFGNFHYRSLEDIFDAIKPYLVKQNLLVLVSDDIVPFGESLFIKATATVLDVLSDCSLSTTAFAKMEVEKKKMDSAQITGMASSYARKYALSALLCLDDVKDADTSTPSAPTVATPTVATPTVSDNESPGLELLGKEKPKKIVKKGNDFIATFANGQILTIPSGSDQVGLLFNQPQNGMK